MSSFYLRDENTGFVKSHDMHSVTLTPVLSGSGAGITNAFEVTAKRVSGPPPVPAVPAPVYGDLITRGDTSDSYHPSFAVGGYMPTVQHAVPLHHRTAVQDPNQAQRQMPQSMPATAIHHLFLTSTAGSAGNLSSYGMNRRTAGWHASMATTPNSRCNICGEIGTHYSSSCSERVNVGVPIGLRPQPQEVVCGALTETAASGEGSGGGDCNSRNGDDDDSDNPLDPSQLDALIRKRPDLPSFLRCRACLALPTNAIWCQCCDIFVCQDCLGPPPDATWACPECEQDAVDNFHVIRVVREVITAWFQAVAVLTDPYCASSDDEKDSIHQFRHVSKKIKIGFV